MQTFDQALFGHVKAGRVTFEDAMRVASSPHDFKLLMQADGRRGTTMEDVAAAEEQRERRQAVAHRRVLSSRATRFRERPSRSPPAKRKTRQQERGAHSHGART